LSEGSTVKVIAEPKELIRIPKVEQFLLGFRNEMLVGSNSLPEDEDALGALVAIFLGLVGLAILASIFGPKCPRCGKSLQRGVRICPHCGANLGW